MSLESRINAVGDSIRALAHRLSERGFRFRYPAEVFPGPEDATSSAIARIEQEIGRLPLALKFFWERIGSVNFCGTHPDWNCDGYADPLVVYPPSHAVDELEDFLADKDDRLRHDFPYLVPIAPDYFHKDGVSGGMWYNLSVPAVADDPPLNDEWHRTTFVSYLELAVKWGGFPGLEDCHDHLWPLTELIDGIGGNN